MDELAEAKSLLETRDPIVVARKSADPYVSYDRTKRMNYYAVCALRARIALYTGDYATAYDEAKTVVGSEKFRFITAPEIAETDSYGEELRSNRVFTPELVFALDNDRITASARAYYEGLSEDIVTSPNCYEAGDLRLNAWLAYNSMNKINLIKYKRSSLAADSYKYPKACTPMLKLSEMYLIAEEAVMNAPAARSRTVVLHQCAQASPRYCGTRRIDIRRCAAHGPDARIYLRFQGRGAVVFLLQAAQYGPGRQRKLQRQHHCHSSAGIYFPAA